MYSHICHIRMLFAFYDINVLFARDCMWSHSLFCLQEIVCDLTRYFVCRRLCVISLSILFAGDCVWSHSGILFAGDCVWSHSVFCLQEVVRVISEERADIHVDIILHRACVSDLGHYCSDVPRGEGRRKSSLSHFHVAIITLLGHLVVSASLVSPVQTSSAVKWSEQCWQLAQTMNHSWMCDWQEQ